MPEIPHPAFPAPVGTPAAPALCNSVMHEMRAMRRAALHLSEGGADRGAQVEW